jgi:hypothetical protein
MTSLKFTTFLAFKRATTLLTDGEIPYELDIGQMLVLIDKSVEEKVSNLLLEHDILSEFNCPKGLTPDYFVVISPK